MTNSLLAPNTSHPAPAASITIASPREEGGRSLPDTSVTEATIEDAYVGFMLFCNPVVALRTDTAALRKAFQALPKSDGKTFRPFALFELIKQLENKELKTWADLAVKLGVTPPDQEKGESSQKIQQYAVRLKRWMHAMHIDAFFDYLLGRKHTYWTEVPNDLDLEGGRDGVTAENDMALWALLPHLRPRRGGRRKREDDLNKSPLKHPRPASPSFPGEMRASPPDGLESWSAHPAGRGAILFPSAEQPRSSILPGPESGFPWAQDALRTPLTAHPQSAMTPVNGSWGDPAEPRSAVTRRRHGPKVLSSAWRSAGTGAGGKPRGRPPNQRNHELARPTIAEVSQVLETPKAAADSGALQPVEAATTPVIMLETNSPVEPSRPTPPGPRPNRPGRLSLQVPPRASGSIRLATPPPALASTEENSTGVSPETSASGTADAPALGPAGAHGRPNPSPRSYGGAQFTQSAPVGGRANMMTVERVVVSDLMAADWTDASGHKIAARSLDEATALAKKITEDMASQGPTPDVFLQKLAALVGGSLLRGHKQVTVKRVEEGPTHSRYDCRWPLVYGTLGSELLFFATVAHDQWKRSSSGGDGEAEVGGEAALWKERYEELLRATTAGAWQAHSLRTRL